MYENAPNQLFMFQKYETTRMKKKIRNFLTCRTLLGLSTTNSTLKFLIRKSQLLKPTKRDFNSAWQDLQIDLDARQSHLSFLPIECKVHAGFKKSYLSLRKILFEEILTFALPIKCIGHSLGGAIACLAAVDYRQKE